MMGLIALAANVCEQKEAPPRCSFKLRHYALCDAACYSQLYKSATGKEGGGILRPKVRHPHNMKTKVPSTSTYLRLGSSSLQLLTEALDANGGGAGAACCWW